MSQHYCETRSSVSGEKVCVLMGWDRMLSNFFLVIEKGAPEDNESDFIYSSDRDPGPLSKPMTYYQEKLADLGISVPSLMVEEIIRDQAHSVGNRQVNWNENGIVFDSFL